MEILEVLWEQDGLTVRKIASAMRRVPASAHQSVLKRVQVMQEKGLVRRDDSERPAKFFANITEVAAKRSLLRDLINGVFGGSMKNLVMHSLAAKKSSRAELDSIRKTLEGMRKER